MFPVSPVIVALFFVFYALMGAVAGALAGVVLCLALRIETHGVWKDSLLGSLGFVLGFIACALMPWPKNTISYYVDGTRVSSTMNRFQHPYAVALTLAVLLPLVHELYRRLRLKPLGEQGHD
jgi:hypothetical protein